MDVGSVLIEMVQFDELNNSFDAGLQIERGRTSSLNKFEELHSFFEFENSKEAQNEEGK